MKKSIINIILLLIIYSNSLLAGDDSFVLSAGINHNFSTNTTNLNNYSICTQYFCSISETINFGIKGVLDITKGFDEILGNGQELQLPIFITLNQKLLHGINTVYTQLGSGIVFDFGGGVESEKSINMGYGIRFSSGFNFNLIQNLGINIEMGIIYKKHFYQ